GAIKEIAMNTRAIGICVMLIFAPAMSYAQSSAPDEWIEETGTQVEGITGRSYLDTSSIHRGEDGLIYFNESTGVSRPGEIGQKGFMKDAYDCAKDIKYMCIGAGDWRNDLKSTIHA